MAIRNTNSQILITDRDDERTVFDTKNNMPHIFGSADFNGIIQASNVCARKDYLGSECLDWLETSPGEYQCLAWQYWYRFYFCDGEYDEYSPLGIFEARDIDFLLARITINSYPQVAILTHSATQIVPTGKQFTLSGSVFFEENRVSVTDTDPGFLRTMQLVKRDSDNQFCIRFQTSTKYTGFVDLATPGVSPSGVTEADVDMKLYWGKFT